MKKLLFTFVVASVISLMLSNARSTDVKSKQFAQPHHISQQSLCIDNVHAGNLCTDPSSQQKTVLVRGQLLPL
jgi:hypothetical protein